MLVIRRHAGESILLGDDIEVEVIECGHNRVKLGIRAPRHVAVLRGEVKQTREENVAAARAISGGTIPAISGNGRLVASGETNGPPTPFLGG
jgi:carbon storage regulator